ncbi:MAG: ribosome hibernation-promoting factor, HPF/YfiA family [Thermodesulfobacteriota bacterium]
MQVNVTFRHIETSEPLRSYAEEKTARLAKYLAEPVEVHWVLTVEKIRHIADATVVGNGVTIKAQADTQDMYSAIDTVIEKLEKQVRKHKEKVKAHKPQSASEPASIRYSVPPAQPAAGRPRIVKKENQFAKPMSIDEAAMQMDVVGNDFLVFTDSSSNNISVLYRLGNGDYGLIETQAR